MKNVEAKPISIEANKYLVASKDGRTATIVDCTTAKDLLFLGYEPSQYLWDVDAEGVISLAANPSVKVSNITHSGSYAVTLGDKGAKIEANGSKLFVVVDGASTLVSGATATDIDESAALTSTAVKDATNYGDGVPFAEGETFMIHRADGGNSNTVAVNRYLSKASGAAPCRSCSW